LNKKALPGWQRFFLRANSCNHRDPTGFVTQPFDRFKQQTESQSGVFPGPLWH
jgi:hypothetical protein